MLKLSMAVLLSLSIVFLGLQPTFANTEEIELHKPNYDEEEVEETVPLDEESKDANQPSLVPGDFFYFVKAMIEKVRLAVTLDDYKEAKLLAEFTAERIHEANALLAEGKKEEAIEILNKAAETQEKAEDVAEEAEGVTLTTGDGSEVKVIVKDQNGNIISNETGSEMVVEEETEDADSNVVVNETTQENDKAEGVNNAAAELGGKLANNIDALLLALSKVDNEQAQASLKKNIQESFTKLDKKLDKLEEKAVRQYKKTNEEVESPTEELVEEKQSEVNIEKTIEKADEGLVDVKHKAKEDAKVTKEKVKAAKEIVKEQKKAAKEHAKQVKKAAEEKAGAVKEKAKEQVKENAAKGSEKANENKNK